MRASMFMSPIVLFCFNDTMHTGFFKKAFILATAFNIVLMTSIYVKNSKIRNSPSDSFTYFKSVTPEEKTKIEAYNHIMLEGLEIKRVADIDKYLGSAKLI